MACVLPFRKEAGMPRPSREPTCEDAQMEIPMVWILRRRQGCGREEVVAQEKLGSTAAAAAVAWPPHLLKRQKSSTETEHPGKQRGTHVMPRMSEVQKRVVMSQPWSMRGQR